MQKGLGETKIGRIKRQNRNERNKKVVGTLQVEKGHGGTKKIILFNHELTLV